MSYRIFKEDDASFHMLHPDGSTFQVAKKLLEPDMISHIKTTIPVHMAEGGIVEDPTEGLQKSDSDVFDDIYKSLSSHAPLPAPKQDPWGPEGQHSVVDKLFANPQLNLQQAQTLLDEENETRRLENAPLPMAQNVQVSQSPRSEGMPDLTQLVNGEPDSNKIPLGDIGAEQPTASTLQEDMQIQGLKDLTKAQSDLAKQQAKEIESTSNELAQKRIKYDQDRSLLDKRDQELTHAYETMKIDPNRVISNMSTGNKIMAGIGMLLSGIGSGLTGQDNMAMKNIDNAINKDIESQKLDLNKQENLLSQNFKRTRDLEQAYLLTKNDVLGALDVNIKRLVANSQSPMVAAKAKMMLGAIQQQRAMNNNSLAMMINKNATVGQKAADQEFGKEYNEWTSGARASVDKNLDKLEGVKETLEKRKNDLIGTSGRVTGRLPDLFRSEESIQLRDDVRSAIMSSLRSTLGAQFTEKEGERIFNMAYNEKLSPKENISKIDSAIKELQDMRDQKEKKVEHFEKYGSLIGFGGSKPRNEMRVKVISPKGVVGNIPRSQLKEALAQGYREG